MHVSVPYYNPVCFYNWPTNTQCTNNVNIVGSITGGSGNFSYAWTKVSGFGTLLAPYTGNSVNATATGSTSKDQSTMVVRLVATDNVTGDTASSQGTITWGFTSNQ